MKVGIVTMYTDDTLNYGNCLQAFASNYKISEILGNNNEVYTLKIKDSLSNRLYTNNSAIRTIRGIAGKIFGYCKQKDHVNQYINIIKDREDEFKKFGKMYIKQFESSITIYDFYKLDFDIYIAGSDVVWGQSKGMINRARFLDFKSKSKIKKISYAASFGRDWMPEENIKDVKRCLSAFDAVSVREASSIELLNKIDIKAVHTLDPTLLLGTDIWEKLERIPANFERDFTIIGENKFNYVFSYILGTNMEMRKAITVWAHQRGFKLVTIPFASGECNNVDQNFGDFQITNCSPENWIWLIHHAAYIITDSFHGVAFSTIFKKKFVVLERVMAVNINNRMIDFLNMIEQANKIIPFSELNCIDMMIWNYERIHEILDEKRIFSINFLKQNLQS